MSSNLSFLNKSNDSFSHIRGVNSLYYIHLYFSLTSFTNRHALMIVMDSYCHFFYIIKLSTKTKNITSKDF